MNKHAYLIIAHSDFYILHKNLQLIDSELNDIYILIDKKVKNLDFDYLKSAVKKSNIYFVPRIKIYWAHFSLVRATMILLEQACKEDYSYLHLISGCDLLVQPSRQIYDFCEQSSGKLFIDIAPEDSDWSKRLAARMQYYRFFVRLLRHNNRAVRAMATLLSSGLVRLQRFVGGGRRLKGIKVYGGSNWASVTGDFARYVLSQTQWVNKHFKYTHCGDEQLWQTLLRRSQFADRLYVPTLPDETAYKRVIDWERGQPYTFTIEDYDALISSPNFFARKFSTAVCQQVIDKIFRHVAGD